MLGLGFVEDDRAGFADGHFATAGRLGLAGALGVGAELEVDLVRRLVGAVGVELEVRPSGLGLVAAFGVEVGDVLGVGSRPLTRARPWRRRRRGIQGRPRLRLR